jgi:rhodanese-related sulfurtransferase
MKELNRTDRLNIAAILFTVILIIGLVTLKKPDIPYALTIEQAAELVISSTDVISPEEMLKAQKNNEINYFITDVRSPVDFQTSHIDQAKNIPIQEILAENNLDQFQSLAEDGITIILYGKDQLEANGAWMILKQIGFNNIRVLEGGFDFYSQMNPGTSGSAITANYRAEEPCCDFKEILKSLGSTSPASAAETPEPVKIIKKEKKSAAEGGC